MKKLVTSVILLTFVLGGTSGTQAAPKSHKSADKIILSQPQRLREPGDFEPTIDCLVVEGIANQYLCDAEDERCKRGTVSYTLERIYRLTPEECMTLGGTILP